MSDLDANLAKAETYLARFHRDGVLNHIGGESLGAHDGGTFESISPIDMAPLATVARGTAKDIDRAAQAAKAAFPAWAAMNGEST